jgi:ubiquinone/menaquinone biosynthesis C-methylase UbiE
MRALLAVAGGITFLKVAVQIYIQLRPRITPPAASFLLDNPLRLRYRSPARTLAPLQLRNGLRVLEVGAGTGAFTLRLMEAVGPDGTVDALELQRGMIAKLKRRVWKNTAATVRLYQADALALPFAASSFDRAVLIACLPMLPDKQRALRELRRVLRPEGLLAVSEELWEPEYVPLAVTRAWCAKAGFVEVARHRELFFYTLVFRNSPGRPEVVR